MALKARFIEEVGTRAALRVYWGKDCPDSCGRGKSGYHNAQIPLSDTDKVGDWDFCGSPEDYPHDRWPTKCDHCEASPAGDAKRQVFRKRLYGTDSGLPEPGDLYWADWYASRKEEGGCVYHDNCEGRHLFAVTPNGKQWDIDGRASNCTRPNDRVHRCWVRTGEPPNVDVGKGGDTCAAGAGSIAVDGYHGFLRNGHFSP